MGRRAVRRFAVELTYRLDDDTEREVEVAAPPLAADEEDLHRWIADGLDRYGSGSLRRPTVTVNLER